MIGGSPRCYGSELRFSSEWGCRDQNSSREPIQGLPEPPEMSASEFCSDTPSNWKIEREPTQAAEASVNTRLGNSFSALPLWGSNRYAPRDF